MKVAVVGGGSTYTPELIDGFARLGENVEEITLIDQATERLSIVGEFGKRILRYFYCHDEVVAEQRTATPRGSQVAQLERELLTMYQDPRLDTKPELLAQRGGAFYSEAAIGLLASLAGKAGTHAVNVRNNGTLPNLPAEAVIEVTCQVDGQGARPLPTTPLSPDLAGLVSHVSAYEDLAVSAARQGSANRVYRALLAHPLVGQAARASQLTDRLLATNAEYLPWAR